MTQSWNCGIEKSCNLVHECIIGHRYVALLIIKLKSASHL